MGCWNSSLLGGFQDRSVSRIRVLDQVARVAGIVMLALGLLAVPGVVRAAITITDTSSAVPWTLSDGSATTSADGVLSGTESFTITTSGTNNVLVVNFTEFAQGNTGLDLSPSMSWNGTPLKQAFAQSSTSSSFIITDIYYLFNPTPAVNGSLVISGSGRDAIVGAYTLTGVNTNINPSGFGAQTAGGTVSVNLPGTTPANAFAATTGAFRLGSGSVAYITSTGPAATKQWTQPSDPSTDMLSSSFYVSGLLGGAVTITQSDNATSRDVLAVAVFAAAPVGSIWNVASGGSWTVASNWGGTVPSGTGVAAVFNASNPTAPAAITLDTAITLNSLVLSNSNQITIAPGGGGSLTFAASGSTLPSVNVTAGSHIISAPISLNANTAFAVNSGLTLSVSGNIVNGTAPSGISLPAGSGTLILGGNNSYSGATSVAGGALIVTGSLGNTPISVSGGALILQSGGAVSQNLATISGGGTLVETAINALSGSAALTVGNGSLVILSQSNNYTGATTVNGGTLQAGMPGSLYNGSSASWTPANISVSSSGLLAVDIGGPNDFSTAQAVALLTNLSTVNNNGLKAGARFGFDTTNSGTATVTYSAAITDSTGPGAAALALTKLGTGALSLTGNSNSYSGPTLATNGELILAGANTAIAGTASTVSAVNTVPAGTTILSIRNGAALGSGTANSSLAPINLNATGGTLSSSILEIGAKIGTDPGPYNADFSYQVVAPGNDSTGTSVATNVIALSGQINLGFLGNSNDGAGFAALTPLTTSPPRIVALYTPTPTGSGSTTLATIAEKTQFGQGSGDHLTFGSPTSNNTLVLENPIDFQGGAQRRWATIRGVGIVPEAELAGAIINSLGASDVVDFDGNGGLIFDSPNTTYTATALQINGGAVYIAANDPAAALTPSALGEGNAAIQVGTSVTVNPTGGTPVPTAPGAHVAFMTYGPNAGIGSLGVTTNRNINVGGGDVTYASRDPRRHDLRLDADEWQHLLERTAHNSHHVHGPQWRPR